VTSNLKGLVLAGGKGNRLRPLTYTGAKQLVPIANKPILFYAIQDLVDAGIRDLTIVVSPETGAQVRDATGDGSRFGAAITYVDQPVPGGIAQAVGVARDSMGDAPFVTFLGDNFLTHGIVPQVQAFEASGADAGILLRHVEDARAFGVAEFDGERLVRVVEKPADPPSDLAVIGIYFFTPRVFDAIAAIRPSARGELEIADAIQWLLDSGANVRADVIDGGWIDTGKHDDLLEANQMILETLQRDVTGGIVDAASRLEGAVVLEAGCEIVGSVIEGPAIIGERTRIERARIGPYTSIGPDCRVIASVIAGSVVMEHTTIEDVTTPIAGSLIGRNVELRGDVRDGYELVLGDFSRARVP
jgi:glucose-1-phosphate thymidylyltransferase